eukprot:COSAG01_NODE_40_length_32708_cov_25.641234_25_plen_234_part_00
MLGRAARSGSSAAERREGSGEEQQPPAAAADVQRTVATFLLVLSALLGTGGKGPPVNVVRVGRSTAAQATTIAGGLQLVPPKQTQRWTVEIEPGIYRERVWVNSTMGPVTLLGLSPRPEDTTLVFHCCPKGNGKPRCSNESVAAVCRKQHKESLGNTETLLVECDDFTAANLTIANDACNYDSRIAAQSQALQVNGDRALFSNVNLWGAQDTRWWSAQHQSPVLSRRCDKWLV